MKGTKAKETGRSEAELASKIQTWPPHNKTQRRDCNQPLLDIHIHSPHAGTKNSEQSSNTPFPGTALYSLQSLIMFPPSWDPTGKSVLNSEGAMNTSWSYQVAGQPQQSLCGGRGGRGGRKPGPSLSLQALASTWFLLASCSNTTASAHCYISARLLPPTSQPATRRGPGPEQTVALCDLGPASHSPSALSAQKAERSHHSALLNVQKPLCPACGRGAPTAGAESWVDHADHFSDFLPGGVRSHSSLCDLVRTKRVVPSTLREALASTTGAWSLSRVIQTFPGPFSSKGCTLGVRQFWVNPTLPLKSINKGQGCAKPPHILGSQR